ncbi:MAG: putative transporter, permease protein [Verrucomicrobia bacterium]|nr:putative transporter, permease protein [Verrucomicrobiota bacterium]
MNPAGGAAPSRTPRGGIIRALLYLRCMSLRNLLLSRLRRLKQPKYLVGAIVGAGYFYMMFFRRSRFDRAGAHAAAAAVVPVDLLPAVISIGAVVLLIFVALAWLVPDQRAGIAFSEAEIAFLFPAPLRRRTLIYYKLVNSQFAILFTVALLTVFTGRWSFLPGNALIHAAGWWMILATLNLHFMGSSFAVTRLMDNGITPWRRRLAVLGVIAVVAVAAAVWLGRDFRGPVPSDYANLRTMAGYVNSFLSTGPLRWLLLPARAVVAPFLASGAAAFFLALGPALLVFAAHFIWVLRSEVSFEDASIAKSEKRAARIAAVREGNWRAARGALKSRAAPFRLAPAGRPEVAFLWKNLLSTFPLFRPRTFVILALVIVAGVNWMERDAGFRGLLPVFSATASMVGAYVILLGPQLARQDLRNDLGNADILKTYPLPGWQVVLGQMLAPVAILTGLLWLVLLALALAFHPQHWAWLTPALRVTIAAVLVPLAPVICALQLLVPNAAALFFPAWVQTMRNRTERGIEMLGQRIIFVGGQMVVVILALVPAALGAFTLVFATQWLIGPVAAVALAGAGVLAILAVEVACGLWWLGRRFEQFDLSAELRP